MNKIFVECLYCGNKWEHNPSPYSYGEKIKCSKCNETTLLKAHKNKTERSDVFGYRFDPKPNHKETESFGPDYWAGHSD